MRIAPALNWVGTPVPTTGRAYPCYEQAVIDIVANRMAAFHETIIPNDAQTAIVAKVLGLMKRAKLQPVGCPKQGARLAQLSQAGKTTITRMIIDAAKQRDVQAGNPSNPYRVLYLELKGASTLKMIIASILKMLGDPHSDKGNFDELLERMIRLVRERDTELLIIDEVQVLDGKTINKSDITDELRALLNMGIVPIFFVGDERAKTFFEKNGKLAARLGAPLELNPMLPKTNAVVAKEFCVKLDHALVASGCLDMLSNLGSTAILNPLLKASGGFIGRICRIVETALEHALMREADYIEPYDFHVAVETYAIPTGFCKTNPFNKREK